MKTRIKIGILVVLVIGMVLMSGCTTNAGSSGATSTPTSTPKTKSVGVTATQREIILLSHLRAGWIQVTYPDYNME